MLQPSAIAKAMVSEAETHDIAIQISPDDVERMILAAQQGGIEKGSEILGKIYSSQQLPYSKVHSGRLIAKYYAGLAVTKRFKGGASVFFE